MRHVIVLLLLASLGWYAYTRQPARVPSAHASQWGSSGADPLRSEPGFRCDGRTHCSQMTSCAEATFFLRNCPAVKMDGDGDGVPCERQWCS
jgi:excalibur calcium-binding domain-containing protein